MKLTIQKAFTHDCYNLSVTDYFPPTACPPKCFFSLLIKMCLNIVDIFRSVGGSDGMQTRKYDSELNLS